MKVIKVLLLVYAVTFLFSCKEEGTFTPNTVEFENYGLPGFTINKLKVYGNYLYAASSNGLYRKTLTLFGAEWENIGPRNVEILALLVLDDNNLIISTGNTVSTSAEILTIYKSTNGGQTWIEWQGGFGGINKEAVYDIIADPSDTDIWYATGEYVVAKTEDGGATWNPVWGDWGNIGTGITFVALDPDNSAKVWAGGQNAIEQGVLLYSNNSGAANSWTEYNDLVAAPSSAKSIAFDASANLIYTGWEGALLKSNGNGNAWNTVINSDENRFFFDVIVDPDIPGTVYTAGWLKNFDTPQSLVLYRSKDNGDTWETFEDSTAGLFGGVYSMEYLYTGTETIIFLGLFKGGVYIATIND